MPSFNLTAFLSLLATFLAYAHIVTAHGYVRSVTVNGVNYRGPVPNNDPDLKSPVRAINSVEPVKAASNPELNCGHSAQLPTLVVDASPGSIMTFAWANGQGGDWPHNTGPILNYMTPCGDQGCASFDSANAQWFKISEQGRKDDGTWVQQDLFEGRTVDLTLPSTLPPGQYLVRHEIIGMHLGTVPGGAEFYPSCTAINLLAPENNVTPHMPDSSFMVTFPGGYSDDEPGIFDPDIFNTNAPYTFPGPSVYTDGPPSQVGAPPTDSSSVPTETTSDAADPTSPNADPTSSAPEATTTPSDEEPAPTSSAPHPCYGKKKRMIKRHAPKPLEALHKKNSVYYKPVQREDRVVYEPIDIGKHNHYARRPGSMSRVMRGIH